MKKKKSKSKRNDYFFLGENERRFMQERESLRRIRKERASYEKEKRESWKEEHPAQEKIRKISSSLGSSAISALRKIAKSKRRMNIPKVSVRTIRLKLRPQQYNTQQEIRNYPTEYSRDNMLTWR